MVWIWKPSAHTHPCHLNLHQGREHASHICQLCKTQGSRTDAQWLELLVPVQEVHQLKLPDSVSEEGHPSQITHLNGGPWMCKVGHSHSLTAHLVCCTTGHAPIRAFQSRFFPEESTTCRCSFPMEAVSHVLYQCLSHGWELEPKEQLCYVAARILRGK
jgi:hypothetical protein